MATLNRLSGRSALSSSGPAARTARRALVNLSRAPAATGGKHSVTIAANDTSRNPGDEIRLSGGRFENYLRNPVVLWGHDDHALPIGRTLAIRHVGSKIKADFEFLPGDEMAERVRNAWKLGFVNAASIRFMPLEVDSRGVVVKWELLEWSLVTIPADPDALRAAARALNVPVEVLRANVRRKPSGAQAERLTPKERADLATVKREIDELAAYIRRAQQREARRA